VFRLVNGTKQDWKSHTELGTAKTADPCERASLSVWSTLEYAQYHLSIYTRFSGIAVAELTPGHGRIARTGKKPGHHSLWIRAKYYNDCASLFSQLPPQ
jgi:hypothetical protein